MLPGPPRSKQITGRPSASASSTACPPSREARKQQQVVRPIDLGDARMLDPSEPVDRIVDREALRLSAPPSLRRTPAGDGQPSPAAAPQQFGQRLETDVDPLPGEAPADEQQPQRPLACGRGALSGPIAGSSMPICRATRPWPDGVPGPSGGVAARHIDQSRRGQRLARQRIVSGEQVEPVAHQLEPPAARAHAGPQREGARSPPPTGPSTNGTGSRPSRLGWRITQKVMW